MNAPTIGAVAGENLRRIRVERGLTQDDISVAVRRAGLSWNRTRVAAFERGAHQAPALGVLLLLAAALEISLNDLLAGDGDVAVSPAATWSRADIRQRVDGATASPSPVALPDVDIAAEALARRLGAPVGDVREAARSLWGRTLTAERDRRVSTLGDVEVRSRTGYRGRVTRELAADIARLLEAS